MPALSRVIGRTGGIGASVDSFSCALCFPAAASIGAAIGPIMALVGVFGLTHHVLAKNFARGIFYAGPGAMIDPAHRRCATENREAPASLG